MSLPLDDSLWERNAEVPLVVEVATNPEGFVWDAPANRQLILRHVVWCLDSEEAGVLLGSGPLLDGMIGAVSDAAGLFLLEVADLEEASAILDRDPLCAIGRR